MSDEERLDGRWGGKGSAEGNEWPDERGAMPVQASRRRQEVKAGAEAARAAPPAKRQGPLQNRRKADDVGAQRLSTKR